MAPALDDRREAAVREVLAALAAGDGLVALTGPAMVGKTAVLDMVAFRLEGAGVRVLRVEGTAAEGGRLTLRALLAQVAGRDIEGMEEGAVEELLDLLDGTGAGVVVAVDDAQNLQPDAAEFFRLLAMLGRGQKRRSRVVFAGRPAFWDVFPDDPKGRTRLVGARIALPGDEPDVVPELPAAVPAAVVEPVLPRRAPWGAMAGGGVAIAGLLLAGSMLVRPRPVAEVAAVIPPIEAQPEPYAGVPEGIDMVPVEAPMAGVPMVPVFAEVPVEAPPRGGTARRWVAEARDDTPPPGGVVPRVVRVVVPQEVPPVGGVAPVRVDPPVEAVVAGRPVPRAPLLVAAALTEAGVVEPPASAEVAPVPVDPVLVAGLMRRGAELVQLGDISAARLAFGRAVAAGEATAATALGRTYDPGFLAEIGGRGIEGDAAEAARWYRRGATMGDAAAAALLRR